MPTSRGSSHVPPLSGVKPRAPNGSQNRASSAATVKSAASGEVEADAGRPAPDARTPPAPAPCSSSGIEPVRRATAAAAGSTADAWPRRVPTAGVAADDVERRRRSGRPRPSSTIARTDSSRPGRVDGVDQRRPSSRRRGRCASRAGRACRRSTAVRRCSTGTAASDRGRLARRSGTRGRSAGGDGVERRLQVGRPAGRVGQAHRPVLAARQQDRGVAGRGDLAPLVLAPRGRGRPPAGRPRRGTSGSRVPRSHWVSPT